MPNQTVTKKSVDSVFNLGSIFERLTNTAIDVVDKVAPVWLQNQLNLDRQMPVGVAPTYQNVNPSNVQPTPNLTNSPGNNAGSIVVPQSALTLALIAGVVGLVVFFATDK